MKEHKKANVRLLNNLHKIICFLICVIWGLAPFASAQSEGSASSGNHNNNHNNNDNYNNDYSTFQIEAKLSELISAENIAPYLTYFKPDEIVRWQISGPANMKDETPRGVIVYVSPTDSGQLYDMWKDLFIEKKLVWIAADKAGNNVSSQRRVLQALLAAQLITTKYKIDKRRIYIAGLSGGGRIASMIAPLYPHIFNGSIFICGANYWGAKTAEQISVLQKNHYAFINGENDFNLHEGRDVYRKVKASGVNNVKFFEVPGLGHAPPNTVWMAKAIDYLDGSPAEIVH